MKTELFSKNKLIITILLGIAFAYSLQVRAQNASHWYVKLHPDAAVFQPVLEGRSVEIIGVQASFFQPAFRIQSPELRLFWELHTVQDWDRKELQIQLKKSPWIESVEAIPLVRSSYVPDDLDSVAHYHLPLIHAPEAWDIGRGDSQVVVAIVDNGVLIAHEDLEAVIWQNPYEIPNNQIDDDGNGYVDDVQGWDIGDADNDPSPPGRAFKHGTHIAGCVGATTDNAKGVASIGFGCHLMPVKLASDQGFADAYPFSDALKGIEYAIINGADIINMSFGGTENLAAGQALIDLGHERGIIFVAAAGNGPSDGNPNTNDTTLEYPASWRHVISVCGTDQNDMKGSFATANTAVDVCAPGEQIRSTLPSVTLASTYGQQRGSSQATAIVSGLLALMLSQNPCLDPEQAERILKAGCSNIGTLNPAWTGKLGAGRIDAAASMNLLMRQSAPVADFARLDSQTCTGRVQFLYQADTSLACPDSFLWSCDCGQQSSLSAPFFLFDSAGIYRISLVVSNAFGRDTLERDVSIQIDSLLLDAGPGQQAGRGDTVRFDPQASHSLIWADWSPGSSMNDSLLLRPWWIADHSRTFYLEVRDLQGCSARDSIFVEVDSTVGIEAEISMPFIDLQVFPQPADSYLDFRANIKQSGNLKLSLIDLNGRELSILFEGFVASGNVSFRTDFSKAIKGGLYFIKWEMNEEVSFQKIWLK